MTVKEARKNAIQTLAKRSDQFFTDVDGTIRRATKAMNAFYRFAGFTLNKFYYENDGRRYNARIAAEMDKKEDIWFKRINGYLKEFNAHVDFAGLYPSICNLDSEHRHDDLFLTYWYN